MAGEDAHDTGREGLQRAKHWLDFTTRVDQSWDYSDRLQGELLHFEWPYARGSAKPLSFDLGGRLRGGAIDGQSFLAEVKLYRYEMDLGVKFLDFLAKCYVALAVKPSRCDHFLWISWSPFQARTWHKHATTENVRRSLIDRTNNRKRVFGVANEADAVAKLDGELMRRVAERVWLITLSDQQESLVPIADHYFKIEDMFKRRQEARQ